jgi:branched-chain amino acid transport system substrate-binding protein
MITRRGFLVGAGTGLGAAMLARRVPAQAEEIRIGTLTPLTGAGSPYGPGMQKAIALAVDEINKAGGPLGRKIRLFNEDGETNPEAAVRGAKKLIEVNRVVAILGTWSSGVTMAVVPLTIKAGIVEMNTSGAPEISTLQDDDLVWRTQAANTLFGEAFARVAWKRGFRKASTMAFNNPSGLGNAGEFKKAFTKAGGQVLASVVYNPNQPSYKAELGQALAPKPEVIVMGSYLPDTTIILKEWYEGGQSVKWIAPGWAVNPKLIQSVGANVVEGVVAVDTVPDFDSPTYKRMNAALTQAMGIDPVTNPYGSMVYDQMILVALAIEAAKSADPKVFKTKIREVSGPPGTKISSFEEGVGELRKGGEINYEGMSSKIDFDAAGDVRPKFGVYEVRGGKLERVEILDLDV